jgi:hypothetical protein
VEGQPAKAHLQTWPRAIEAQELFEMAGCSKAGDGAREEYLLLIAASPDPDWTFVSPACKGLLQRYRPRTSEGAGFCCFYWPRQSIQFILLHAPPRVLGH